MFLQNDSESAIYGARQKAFYHEGQIVSVVGSALCVAVCVFFPRTFCGLFGADATTIDFTILHIGEYCWGFVVGRMNTITSAYFYSTKRSSQAITLNAARSLAINSLFFTILLPKLFGSVIVWHTVDIYELVVLFVAIALKRFSERNEITYSAD